MNTTNYSNPSEADPACAPKRIVRLGAVMDRTGTSRSQIYRLIKLGKFPRPVRLGDNARGWIESEVDNWIDARIQQRDAQGEG